jgi:hypothetical protein
MSTDAIIVRRARADDLAGVLAIDHIAGRADEIRHAILHGRCLIAEDGADIVGFCVDGGCSRSPSSSSSSSLRAIAVAGWARCW